MFEKEVENCGIVDIRNNSSIFLFFIFFKMPNLCTLNLLNFLNFYLL
jgi:hypothetical protein